MSDIDWSKTAITAPVKKKAISIRIDEDVLTFFKRQGSYQARMNAVLRAYVEHQRASKAKR